MKKLATFVFAMLLTGSLAFAQATTGGTGAQTDTTKSDTGKKAHKGGKKAHKGGKKSKKGSTDNTTPAPK
jgi:hypothetical protein